MDILGGDEGLKNYLEGYATFLLAGYPEVLWGWNPIVDEDDYMTEMAYHAEEATNYRWQVHLREYSSCPMESMVATFANQVFNDAYWKKQGWKHPKDALSYKGEYKLTERKKKQIRIDAVGEMPSFTLFFMSNTGSEQEAHLRADLKEKQGKLDHLTPSIRAAMCDWHGKLSRNDKSVERYKAVFNGDFKKLDKLQKEEK